MEEIKIEKSFSELSRQVREFPDELKALEDKISQMRALLDEVNRLTAALVDKLCAAVESEQIEGVRPIGAAGNCIAVKFSALQREGNWAPKTFIPRAQAEAVKAVLEKHLGNPTRLCLEVRTMLETKKVSMPGSVREFVNLNTETLRILAESDLANLAEQVELPS